jgi:hypothetical protein
LLPAAWRASSFPVVIDASQCHVVDSAVIDQIRGVGAGTETAVTGPQLLATSGATSRRHHQAGELI